MKKFILLTSFILTSLFNINAQSFEKEIIVDSQNLSAETITFDIDIGNNLNNNIKIKDDKVSKEKENLVFRECFVAGQKQLLKIRNDELKKMYFDYRQLRKLARNREEKIKILDDYRRKISDLENSYLLQLELLKSNCQVK
ncbi:MAG: hypothetical protein NZ822_01730 [Patescibacteria group bacterium]|nr:hypothetical protein [Patescibacteria group bacterium]